MHKIWNLTALVLVFILMITASLLHLLLHFTPWWQCTLHHEAFITNLCGSKQEQPIKSSTTVTIVYWRIETMELFFFVHTGIRKVIPDSGLLCYLIFFTNHCKQNFFETLVEFDKIYLITDCSNLSWFKHNRSNIT